MDNSVAYCADQLRQFDRDRYTICATTGGTARRALFALFAFNLEIAKIREIVSEPMLGQIRLQWWREAIEGIYAGTPRQHAVVTALADAVGRCNPSRARFDRLIDARAFDLEDRQPGTIEDLIAYADATSGELTGLVLEMLGAAEHAAQGKGRDAGIAWALNGLLRAIPFHAAQRRCYLPMALTEAHRLSLNRLFAGDGGKYLVDAVSEIANLAERHLEQARQDRNAVEIQARPAFAGLAVIAADLKGLKKAGYDVFAAKPLGPFRRRWLLSRV